MSILEVGPGFGKWGVLLREYLEVYGNMRFHDEEWKIRIDAIEICEDYKNKLKEDVYSFLYWGDIMHHVDSAFMIKYELVIMLDVIEHLDKEEGISLINKLKQYADNILIMTPKKLSMTHSAWHDINKHEDHKCVWTADEFIKLGFMIIQDKDGPLIARWNKTPKNLN